MSCGMNSKKPQEIIRTVTVTEKAKIVCPDAPKLVEPSWKKIIWVVATAEDGIKILGLTESQYKNLAINTQNSLKAIRDRNLVINYYRECLINHNEEVD